MRTTTENPCPAAVTANSWNKKLSLTVVIPVYNREREIKRCLDSIAAQSLAPERVIVVDDGSTDNSAAVARNHPLRPEVVEGAHAGAAAARNVGLNLVETQWTMFFDSDDTMEPGHIEAAVRSISPEADIIGWDVTRIDSAGRRVVKKFEYKYPVWSNLMDATLATQRYMARTELFRKAGGWNPEVGVWDDIELGNRLLTLNPKIIRIDGNRVNIYQSQQSITGLRWSDNFDTYHLAFNQLRKNMPADKHGWLSLKKAVLAADIYRESPTLGRKLYEEVLSELNTLTSPASRNLSKAESVSGNGIATYIQKASIRLAYRYRRMGLRGICRLLRPLFIR